MFAMDEIGEIIEDVFARSNTDLANFHRDIQKLSKLKTKSLICGDFNARHRLWNCIKSNRMGKVLFEEIQRGIFSLHSPNEPTYIPSCHRRSPSTLDLILGVGQIDISSPTVLKIFSSDHFPIIFKTIDCKIIDKPSKGLPNYALANWLQFKNIINNRINVLSLNLQNITNTSQIDIMVTYLTKLITLAQKNSIPLFTPVKFSLVLPEYIKERISLRNS
uniref:Endo/exonuclease/phosphatase domain-containing protein n=1 Tax=Anopheles epiroticus TaxID=199890 RepID=A0A182P7G8_9DIPT